MSGIQLTFRGARLDAAAADNVCSICGLTFKSAQAFGSHKRSASHLKASLNSSAPKLKKKTAHLIDSSGDEAPAPTAAASSSAAPAAADSDFEAVFGRAREKAGKEKIESERFFEETKVQFREVQRFYRGRRTETIRRFVTQRCATHRRQQF